MRKILMLAACFSFALADVSAQDKPVKPHPDLSNVKYGDNERNVLDLWKRKALSRPRSSSLSMAAAFVPEARIGYRRP